MGRRATGEEVKQIKATRERLLTLFDRPGWGARTLRGFRDGGSNRGFDEASILKDKGPSRIKPYEVAEQSMSPQGTNDNPRWIPNARPRGRRESRIRDKIRFFDGRMDFQPSGHNDPWKVSGADSAVAFQSPSKFSPVASTTKPDLYSVFPQKQHTGTLTPIKSYGYLRPKEITPLPWRPLDSRRWETAVDLANSPERMRGRTRERFQHALVTPAPANAATAVRNVEIVHQDPKRNISKKVNVLYTARSKEGRQEVSIYGGQKEGPNSASPPFTQASSSRKPVEKQGANDESAAAGDGKSGINGAESVEQARLAKESKIQDRINLFSNYSVDMETSSVPMTRMRNQSTPSKLPSQAAYGTPTKTSHKVPQPNRITGSQVEEQSTEVTAFTVTDTVASGVLPETVANWQWPKPQTQELAVQVPAPRKSSSIGDKIQHFEAFSSAQGASVGCIIVNNNRKWCSPQSKRIQTWPMLANENVFNRKTEQAEVPGILEKTQHIRQEVENVANSVVSNRTEGANDKVIKRYQDIERARQKIYFRQERLNRRSRSRSRPAASISGPSNELEEERQAFNHLSQHFKQAKEQREKKIAIEEARQKSKIQLEIKLDTDSQTQHSGDETVQEIWIDGSADGPTQEVVVVDRVVAQCELAEPRPMRLAETLRMIRLCRGRFEERSGTWRRKVGRSSEKGGLAV
jgi:hypothetical protein